MRRNPNSGASVLEFTLVGIPIIFILISIFEISRGMWIYTTLAHSVREGVRFAIVHGADCSVTPNNCVTNVEDIVAVIRDAGIGLEATKLELRFNVNCPSPTSPSSNNPCSTLGTWATLGSYLGNANRWPPVGSNNRDDVVEIEAFYPFRSAIAMFWPGATRGINFGVFNLPASSRERIQF